MAGRSLTAGEITMATTIYKTEINYATPQVFNEKWAFFQPDDRAMSPNGNIYYAPASTNYHADFSAAGVPLGHRATFIHELGHVWQHQHGQWVTVRGAFERDYDYLPITADTNFDDLGIEGQAQLLRDYYYVLNGQTSIHYTDGTSETFASRADYERVIPWQP